MVFLMLVCDMLLPVHMVCRVKILQDGLEPVDLLSDDEEEEDDEDDESDSDSDSVRLVWSVCALYLVCWRMRCLYSVGNPGILSILNALGKPRKH